MHPLSAEQLAAAGGSVRCARCGKDFNALDALFDDYPDKRREPSKKAESRPPELGRKPVPDFPAAPLEPPVMAQAKRWPWGVALGMLTLLTTFNLLWAFRDHIAHDSALGTALHGAGLPGFAPPAPFRDPSRMHLLSRDMHSHPTQPGVLVLSATFTNLASQAQPYPVVAVTLTDGDDQVLGARNFQPGDYLRQAPPEGALLASREQVPILLEFADPGEEATGFEITFH